MRNFLRVVRWLILAGALAVGGWWAWPLVFPTQPPGFLSRLAKADSALQQGRPEAARKALEPWPEGISAGQWAQWEKRIHSLAVLTKDWKWAESGARKALEQFPGNPDLGAFLTWVLLKSGRPAEGLTIAEKTLLGTAWEPLLVQARVENGLFKSGVTSDGWATLSVALASPEGGSPELYEKILGLAPEALLKKNALLEALSVGRVDMARKYLDSLTENQRNQPPFDRLQAYMAYDQEDWLRSAALLRNLGASDGSTYQVLADVYLHLQEFEQARIIYDQMLADATDPKAIPASLYLNRATIALIQKDPGTALALLNRALLSSGQDTTGINQIRLLLLEARQALGEDAEVRLQLDKVLGNGEESAFQLEAELLKYRLFPQMLSLPRLWSLMHRHPDYPPLVERLVWLLIQQKDFSGAQRALDLFQAKLDRSKEPPWWSLHYQSLLLALQNQFAGSILALEKIPAQWRDTSYYTNLALVQTVRSRQVEEESKTVLLNGALESDTKALDLVSAGKGSEELSLRSRLLAHRGLVTWSLVPYQKPSSRKKWKELALEDLRKAVQLDPENLRAAFLLRQAASTQDAP